MPNETPAPDAAIADLQSRLTFQEDMLNALNRVVAAQDASIATLQQQVQHLNRKLNELTVAVEENPETVIDKPPHY